MGPPLFDEKLLPSPFIGGGSDFLFPIFGVPRCATNQGKHSMVRRGEATCVCAKRRDEPAAGAKRRPVRGPEKEVAGSGAGAFGGILVSSKLTQYRLEQLEKKVQAHNSLIERTYKLEERSELQEEKIRVVNHRIEDLESALRDQEKGG